MQTQILNEFSKNYNKSTPYLKDRISYAAKIANNYEWVRNKIDYYSRHHLSYNERKKQLEINYNLYNGQYEEKDYAYLFKQFGFETELKNATFKHFDIMSEPLREIVGEEERRPFEPMVVAINADAVIRKREEKAKLLQQYIYMKAIAPIMEQAEQVPPEQREQFLKENTPEEIEKFMTKKYKSPEETQAQRLLNWLSKKEYLNRKFNLGWKDVAIGAQEVYYVTTENGHPTVKLINPKNFIFDSSEENIFIEDGEWASYEHYLTITDIYKQYGEYFTEKDRKALDEYINDDLYNLDKGQSLFNGELIESFGTVYDVSTYHKYLRVVHTVFKTLKKIKFILTNTPEGPKEFLVDETYKFNPELDIEETVAYIPEVWEGTRIGTDIYVNMGPVKNQYTSLQNPFSAKLPYYGAIYESRNSVPVSLLDRAKAWNYMFDVAFYRLEEAIGSDLGNVMITLQKSIPKNWTPEKWLAFLKATKVALIDPTQDGLNAGSDPQYWKSINVSNNSDISKYLNLLSYCQEQCYKSIGTNVNRIGSASVSESVGNNQQKLIQSANITEPLFSLHNQVKERVLTGLINEALQAYKGNPQKTAYVLDDGSIDLLDMNTENLSLEDFGVFLSNSVEDYNMVQSLRANLSALIQNSDGDLRLISTALRTKNPAALDELIHEKYESIEKQRQAAQQSEQELKQAALQVELEQRQLDRENELRIAMIRSMGYVRDADVNKDMIPDMLQMEKFNKEFEIKLRELDLRKEELMENNKSEEADRQVEREKIAADLQKSKQKSAK